MIRLLLIVMAISALASTTTVVAPVAAASHDSVVPLAASAPIVIPVAGVEKASLKDTFNEGRVGHIHHAIDILAPRGTPVVAAVDGKIVKLFTSAAGGLTIYQFDRDQQLVYYYAHLDGYNVGEGAVVHQGDVIGFVGTTGNAPPGTPHLHFAIEKLGPEKQWWRSEAIDPYPILVADGVTLMTRASAPPARLSASR